LKTNGKCRQQETHRLKEATILFTNQTMRDNRSNRKCSGGRKKNPNHRVAMPNNFSPLMTENQTVTVQVTVNKTIQIQKQNKSCQVH